MMAQKMLHMNTVKTTTTYSHRCNFRILVVLFKGREKNCSIATSTLVLGKAKFLPLVGFAPVVHINCQV